MTKTILGFVTFETLSTILTIKNLIHDNPWQFYTYPWLSLTFTYINT